ncbi:MAG TPA: hypothetical protein VGF56_05920 [Rhizomicrobium sp.]|jgi:hypothetical protein
MNVDIFDGIAWARGVPIDEAFPEPSDREWVERELDASGVLMGGGAAPLTYIARSADG